MSHHPCSSQLEPEPNPTVTLMPVRPRLQLCALRAAVQSPQQYQQQILGYRGHTPWPHVEPTNSAVYGSTAHTPRSARARLQRVTSLGRAGDTVCVSSHAARTPHMVAASSRKPATKFQNHLSGPCGGGRTRQCMMECSGYCEADWIRLRNERLTVTSNVGCEIRRFLFQRVVVLLLLL